jgi:AcrR family transcriptional regulator
MGSGIGPRDPGDPPATAAARREEVLRLIRAGIEEIEQRGDVDPRVSDIVRRAGLSNKAFYRHFRSKDELLLAVLEEGMQLRMQEFERRLAAAGSALDRVRAWVWVILEQAQDPTLSAATRPILAHQARLAESLGPQLWQHRDRLRESIQEILEEGKRSGELSDCDPEGDADAIQYLAMGWMHGQVLARVIPTREACERIVEFAIRGLRRR